MKDQKFFFDWQITLLEKHYPFRHAVETRYFNIRTSTSNYLNQLSTHIIDEFGSKYESKNSIRRREVASSMKRICGDSLNIVERLLRDDEHLIEATEYSSSLVDLVSSVRKEIGSVNKKLKLWDHRGVLGLSSFKMLEEYELQFIKPLHDYFFSQEFIESIGWDSFKKLT